MVNGSWVAGSVPGQRQRVFRPPFDAGCGMEQVGLLNRWAPVELQRLDRREAGVQGACRSRVSLVAEKILSGVRSHPLTKPIPSEIHGGEKCNPAGANLLGPGQFLVGGAANSVESVIGFDESTAYEATGGVCHHGGSTRRRIGVAGKSAPGWSLADSVCGHRVLGEDFAQRDRRIDLLVDPLDPTRSWGGNGEQKSGANQPDEGFIFDEIVPDAAEPIADD